MEVREWLLPTKLCRHTVYQLPLVQQPVCQTKLLQCFRGDINKQILGMHLEIKQAAKGICIITKIQLCIGFVSSSSHLAAVITEEAIEVDNKPFASPNSFCLLKLKYSSVIYTCK